MKENRKFTSVRVVDVKALGPQNGVQVHEVTLENGITYNWSEDFLRERGMSGLKTGDYVEVCGRRGNSKAALWGGNLRDVRMGKRY